MSAPTSAPTPAAYLNASTILPLSLVDSSINQRVTVLLRHTHKQLTGILRGYDDFVNIVLEDVVESEYVMSEGRTMETRLDSILLNGNNITIIIPQQQA